MNKVLHQRSLWEPTEKNRRLLLQPSFDKLAFGSDTNDEALDRENRTSFERIMYIAKGKQKRSTSF
jgi:hypothetical protein